MTIKEWLTGVASTNTSSDKDSAMMEHLLHRVGFPLARVVVGVVYTDGHGTLESPPVDIHSMAKMMLAKA